MENAFENSWKLLLLSWVDNLWRLDDSVLRCFLHASKCVSSKFVHWKMLLEILGKYFCKYLENTFGNSWKILLLSSVDNLWRLDDSVLRCLLHVRGLVKIGRQPILIGSMLISSPFKCENANHIQGGFFLRIFFLLKFVFRI